jgi:DNA-binding CsgD family transcriptional regulator
LARGESVLHPRVAARVVQEVRGARRDTPNLFTDLSDRELEVLRLIADGLSNAEIANKLVRHGSNGLDSSSPTERHNSVMLSAAKHLCAECDRPFASLRVTRCDCSNCQVQFVQIEPCLISEKTVKGHVSNILSKLHMMDRTQAAVYAWQQGLVARRDS